MDNAEQSVPFPIFQQTNKKTGTRIKANGKFYICGGSEQSHLEFLNNGVF